jgi:hypothetical protein
VFRDRSVKPGWTVPAVILGVTATAVGWWLFQSNSTLRLVCDFTQALSFATDAPRTTGCTRVHTETVVAVVLLAGGIPALVIGSLVASRRGLRAARQGRPWPVRRRLTRAARVLDSRLPGFDGSKTRIKQQWLAALLFVAMVFGVIGAANGWHAYRNGVRRHQYATAQRELATMRLPASMTLTTKNDLCELTSDQVCASSAKAPEQLLAVLAALLHGKPDSTECEILGTPDAECPVMIKGKLGGYPVLGFAFKHMVTVRSGKPPAGAIRVRPKFKTLFYLGSDITIELAPLS